MPRGGRGRPGRDKADVAQNQTTTSTPRSTSIVAGPGQLH